MFEEVFELMKDSVEGAKSALKTSLSRIRTGRANAALLDSIRVDYYGTMTPLNQMAAITTPEPRQIMVKPWDRTSVTLIEKAIKASSLGLNPASDGEIIRIPVPALTEERRRDLIKMAQKNGEDTKVAIRNARRDANEMLKEMETKGSAPKDDVAKALKKVQELTDEAVSSIDKIIEAKEQEITEI